MPRQPSKAAPPPNRRRAVAEKPVFLLCGGVRTGSTLLQRLLISTGEVLIWGEHGGALIPPLMSLREDMQNWQQGRAAPLEHLAAFRSSGYNAWIPNMNPPLGHFEDGCRALLARALGRPARALGYSRWGFKEVRYGSAAATFMQALYPDAGFVLLVRDPQACLKSVKSTAWGERAALKGSPLEFLRTWAGLSEELHQASSSLTRAVLIRYEDLLHDPRAAVERVGRVAGIPVGRFKVEEVFGHKDGGPRVSKTPFTDADRRALDDPAVRRVAKLLGY